MGRLDDAKKQAKETAVIVEDALRGIAGQIASIFEDALDTSNSTVEASAKEVQKIFNNLAKVGNMFAEANQKAAEGAFRLSDRLRIVQQRQAKIFALEQQIEIARRNGADNIDALEKKLNEVRSAEEEVTKELDAQLELSKKINRQLGLTGGILGGLKTVAQKLGLGNIEEAFENANAAALEVAKTSEGLLGRFRVLGAALGSLGGSVIDFLTDPLAILGLLSKGIVSLVKLGDQFAKKTADIGKSFLGLGNTVGDIKKDLMDVAGDEMYLNFEEAFTAMKSLNEVTGTQVRLTRDQVMAFQKYTEMLGMSEETTQGLFKVAQLSGESFGDLDAKIGGVVQGLNRGDEAAISLNGVIDDVANASATTAFNLGNNPEALAKAAFNAKRLGMTMDQISAAAASTLDFESSIQNEMEAELLLGKNLNLEQLRYAALTGDVDTQAKEINRLLKENIDSTEGNVIKQEALAKSLGMSVEDMLKANQARLIQNKLGKLDAQDKILAEKRLNQLMSEGLTEKEALEKLSRQDLDNIKAQAESSQKLSRLSETFKEKFLAGLDKSGAIDKINEMVKNFAEGGGMEKIGNLIAKAAGMLGSLVKGMIENPGKTLAAFGTALGAVLLAQKAIPQLVIPVGGALGKVGSMFKGGGGKGGKKGFFGRMGDKIKGGFSKVKGVFKGGGKAFGKSLLKKIPGVGLLAGVGFGLQRAMKGDFAGAALELSSGALSTIPGLGTVASGGIDAALLARDMSSGTAADFISRPGQPIQKFRSDDIVIGGTNLGGSSSGGGSNGEIVSLLKELISAVKEGGDVFLDSNKVGKSLALATSNMG